MSRALRGMGAEISQEFILFNGGYDTVTPPLALSSGCVRNAQNFEHDINGGYVTTTGHERADGQLKPSNAAYAVLTCVITGAVSTGDVLTDDTAAAYGTVIALPSGLAVLTKITGTFATGNIKVGVTVVGTCTGPQIVDGASTPSLHAQYKNLAADVYRALIQAVPGSGDILGVKLYNDVLYAFRNNVGGTAAAMYKSTASGWSLVAMGRELAFTSGGTYVMTEGDTITGATSGATAVLTRVALASGTFAAGSGAGLLIFASQTGTFQAENLNVGLNTNVATIAGDSSAITFAVPGGRFEFALENFGGGANTTRMYGADGKNRGFEFDGTVFTPIVTGMSADTPLHVVGHKNQLFFSFLGSIQHSAPGQPFMWSAVTGAAELAMGDTVTGFNVQPGSEAGGALAITCRNKIGILYGTDVSDWNLVAYKTESGALPYSIQRIANTIMFDDRGITNLETSQAFGNFSSATLSRRIQNWLRDKRTKITDSCVSRNKNQYRLYFSDGYAIYATFDNKKLLGMMPILFPNPVKCVDSSEMLDGSEAIYFGSTDGYIYEMDKGTSFDGAPIEAFIDLAFDHSKSPRTLKQYRKATFEISGNGYAEFGFSYEIGYNSAEIDQSASVTSVTSFTAGQWDSGTWDAFVWDGVTLSPTECDMTGTAENMSIKLRSYSDYFLPAKFSGALISFTPRRNKR
jgi:hypothetical protein